MITGFKSLTAEIKNYILEGVEGEDRAELISELKRYKKEFPNKPDYNYYRYGNILPYYSQIRSFLTEHGFNPPKDDIKMCERFCFYVGLAIDSILKEGEA